MSKLIRNILPVVVGNFIMALAITLFIIPGELVSGGTTGISLTVEHLFHIPLSLFMLIFNVVMLVVGLLILGKKFALTTLASTFLSPLFIEICQRVIKDTVLTDDIFLCTVFAGLGVGVGLGIVIRSGASTGGMDIPPLVLNKLVRIPVSVSLYVFDFAILLLQAMFRPMENILYGIVLVIIYTIVLDKVLIIGNSKTELKIISDKHKEISDAILNQVDRGVTLINSEGGYLHKEGQLILSVVSNRELARVERLVRDIDPESFMVISRVSEVRGKGFTLPKK